MRTRRSNLISTGDPRAASSFSTQPMLDGFGTLHYLLASAGRRELGQDKGQQWHDLSATLYSENTEQQSRRTKRKKKREEFVFGKHNLGGEGPLLLFARKGRRFFSSSPSLSPQIPKSLSLLLRFSFRRGWWRTKEGPDANANASLWPSSTPTSYFRPSAALLSPLSSSLHPKTKTDPQSGFSVHYCCKMDCIIRATPGKREGGKS